MTRWVLSTLLKYSPRAASVSSHRCPSATAMGWRCWESCLLLVSGILIPQCCRHSLSWSWMLFKTVIHEIDKDLLLQSACLQLSAWICRCRCALCSNHFGSCNNRKQSFSNKMNFAGTRLSLAFAKLQICYMWWCASFSAAKTTSGCEVKHLLLQEWGVLLLL